MIIFRYFILSTKLECKYSIKVEIIKYTKTKLDVNDIVCHENLKNIVY